MIIRNLISKHHEVLNSLTKYPSILTYHRIDPKTEKLIEELSYPGKTPNIKEIRASEKIDGTNARILITDDNSYAIGSREKFLLVQGDILHLNDMEIVKAFDAQKGLLKKLQGITLYHNHPASLTVVYGEIAGGKINRKSRNYTPTASDYIFRCFDIKRINTETALKKFLTPQAASSHRENNPEEFLNLEKFNKETKEFYLQTPTQMELESLPPISLSDTYEWLHQTIKNNGLNPGKTEGIVLRDNSRNWIVKLRLQDYKRALS